MRLAARPLWPRVADRPQGARRADGRPGPGQGQARRRRDAQDDEVRHRGAEGGAFRQGGLNLVGVVPRGDLSREDERTEPLSSAGSMLRAAIAARQATYHPPSQAEDPPMSVIESRVANIEDLKLEHFTQGNS